MTRGFLLPGGQASLVSPKHSWKQVEWMMHTPTGKSAIYNEVYYPQKADGTPVKAHHNNYRHIGIWLRLAEV